MSLSLQASLAGPPPLKGLSCSTHCPSPSADPAQGLRCLRCRETPQSLGRGNRLLFTRRSGAGNDLGPHCEAQAPPRSAERTRSCGPQRPEAHSEFPQEPATQPHPAGGSQGGWLMRSHQPSSASELKTNNRVKYRNTASCLHRQHTPDTSLRCHEDGFDLRVPCRVPGTHFENHCFTVNSLPGTADHNP